MSKKNAGLVTCLSLTFVLLLSLFFPYLGYASDGEIVATRIPRYQDMSTIQDNGSTGNGQYPAGNETIGMERYYVFNVDSAIKNFNIGMATKTTTAHFRIIDPDTGEVLLDTQYTPKLSKSTKDFLTHTRYYRATVGDDLQLTTYKDYYLVVYSTATGSVPTDARYNLYVGDPYLQKVVASVNYNFPSITYTANNLSNPSSYTINNTSIPKSAFLHSFSVGSTSTMMTFSRVEIYNNVDSRIYAGSGYMATAQKTNFTARKTDQTPINGKWTVKVRLSSSGSFVPYVKLFYCYVIGD